MKKYYDLTISEPDEDTGEQSADLYIFGEIVDNITKGFDDMFGFEGDTSGLSMVKDLTSLPDSVTTVNVHINSPGGLVDEGLAIYNTLKALDKKVVTTCDGVAASAASLIFMAGDERIMSDASLLFVHNPWTNVQGNAAQLREEADNLDKMSEAVTAAYTDNSKVDTAHMTEILDGTSHGGTWLTAGDALDLGMCTDVRGTQAKSTALAMASLVKAETSTKVNIKNDVGANAVDINLLADKIANILSARFKKTDLEMNDPTQKPEKMKNAKHKTLAELLFKMED